VSAIRSTSPMLGVTPGTSRSAAGALAGAPRFEMPSTSPAAGGMGAPMLRDVAAAGLLMLQSDRDLPERRRRASPAQAAQQGLDGLRALQQAMLGGDGAADPAAVLAKLSEGAAALRDCGEEGPLQRAMLLRIRIEQAKRGLAEP
jgi:hypothetical protein